MSVVAVDNKDSKINMSSQYFLQHLRSAGIKKFQTDTRMLFSKIGEDGDQIVVQCGLTGSDGNETFGKILRRFEAGLCLEDGLAGSSNRCMHLIFKIGIEFGTE